MPHSLISDLGQKLPIEKFQPTQDHVLFEVLTRRKSKLGLILPKEEKTECLYGRVLKVGPGEMNRETGTTYPIGVKPGDIIMSVQYMGEKVQAVGKNYRLLREHGIWAKLEIDRKSETDWDITSIHPYADKLLVDLDREEKSIQGHIFLPNNPQAMYRRAKVVATGPGKRKNTTGVVIPSDLKPGDNIVCMRYSGCVVHVKGVEYRLMQEEDAVAIIDGDIAKVDCIAGQHALAKPVDDYEVIPDSHLAELNRKTIMDNGGKV